MIEWMHRGQDQLSKTTRLQAGLMDHINEI